MRFRNGTKLSALVLAAWGAMAWCSWPAASALAQEAAEVYTATVIASEGMAGATGRISIRIVSSTSPAEKDKLRQAFQKSPADGMALLRTMSKGYINVEGGPGRKIEAVFTRDRSDGGRDLIVVGEHIASKLEQREGVNPADYPAAVVHLRLDAAGDPASGEVFPAVKLAVTPEGFVDVQSGSANKVIMVDLARR